MSQALESRQLSGYYGLRVRPGDARSVANDPEADISDHQKILLGTAPSVFRMSSLGLHCEV
jgi:hypothetical protein